MEPASERTRTRRLRAIGWIAVAGAALSISGAIFFARGVERLLEEPFGISGNTAASSSLASAFPMTEVALLATLIGAGLVLGTFVGWCVIFRPQFRLRTCFVASLVLAALLASTPYVALRAERVGISIHGGALMIERDLATCSVPLNNPLWLVPTLVPAATVVLFARWIYRR